MAYCVDDSNQPRVPIAQQGFCAILSSFPFRRSPCAALFAGLWLTAAAAAERSIGFIHVNDVYQIAPIEPAAQRGGLARLATLVRETKEKNPSTLFLFGGDTISPSMESVLFKGRQMIAAWNELGVDAASYGNHEFDFGPDILRQRLAESRFPWLAANLRVVAGAPLPNTQAGKLFLLNGIKVGIVGLITPDTINLSKPGNGLAFDDLKASAERAVAELKAQGAQVLVGLTHVSIEDDRELAALGLFDLILGGHEHSMIRELVGRTPIFKAGSDARDALHIRLRFGPAGDDRLRGLVWEWLPVDKNVAEDQKILALAADFEKQIQSRLGETIGQTNVGLDGRTDTVRRRESNLGNFIADALRHATGADVALINGGGLRADRITGPGPLTRRDVQTWLPFENTIVVLAASGKQLRQTLEHGLAKMLAAGASGAMPQVSGLKLRYDPALPAGQRIVSLTVGGKPVEEKRSYRLVTTSFLAGGGDDYALLPKLPVLRPAEGSPLDADIVSEAILATKEIAPAVEGRIAPVAAVR